mmetsp:Transcript_4457/g.18399  ORF Transcript_4457/g.18399 Transcript_4457/m.18399 type:complete len:215 (-) Transcript_4457:1504-2148(-)
MSPARWRWCVTTCPSLTTEPRTRPPRSRATSPRRSTPRASGSMRRATATQLATQLATTTARGSTPTWRERLTPPWTRSTTSGTGSRNSAFGCSARRDGSSATSRRNSRETTKKMTTTTTGMGSGRGWVSGLARRRRRGGRRGGRGTAGSPRRVLPSPPGRRGVGDGRRGCRGCRGWCRGCRRRRRRGPRVAPRGISRVDRRRRGGVRARGPGRG